MNQLIITKSVENHAYFLENGLFSQNNWMDDIQTHKKNIETNLHFIFKRGLV